MAHWQTTDVPFLRNGVYYERRVLVPDGPGDGCHYHSDHPISEDEARQKLGLPQIPKPAPPSLTERIFARQAAEHGFSESERAVLREYGCDPDQMKVERYRRAEETARLSSPPKPPKKINLREAIYGRQLTDREKELHEQIGGRRVR